MEGLNKLCLCPCTWDHEYPSMHAGLSSIAASRSRSKLAPTATLLTAYFDPLHQPKPLFLPKIVTHIPIFSTLAKILEFFHSKTPNRLEFEKNVPKCPLFLWLLSLKDPLFFALHARVWGGCCSLKHGQKLEILAFLKQNRAIWWILLGTNLIKVMKTKFQFYRLNRSNYALWKNFIGGQGWLIHRPSPAQTLKEIYPTTMILHTLALSKQTPSVPEAVRAEAFKCEVQCRARWRAWENFEI